MTDDADGRTTGLEMGMTARPEEFVAGPVPGSVRGGEVGGVKGLTRFVDTAVPALLLLTLMAGEQNSETTPDLKQLASMLSELQEAAEEGGKGPDSGAVGRLFRAVMDLKGQKPDHEVTSRPVRARTAG